jgi:hypothetical protein
MTLERQIAEIPENQWIPGLLKTPNGSEEEFRPPFARD